MDELDMQICTRLIANSRLTFRDLGEFVNLSVNAVHRRVQALVNTGVIQRFVAHQSLYVIGGLLVLIFGNCAQPLNDEIAQALAGQNNAIFILGGSGNQLYVLGMLRSIHELDAFTRFVKDKANMLRPDVGIMNNQFLWKSPPDEAFVTPLSTTDKTDLAIIRSLHHDARKSLIVVADEIGASVQTVKRRLERLMKNRGIQLTIEWQPNYSDEIITLVHLQLRPQCDRDALLAFLREKLSPRFFLLWTFSNMPQLLIAWVWTKTMKELETITGEIHHPSIEVLIPNILLRGHTLETWRDDVLHAASVK